MGRGGADQLIYGDSPARFWARHPAAPLRAVAGATQVAEAYIEEVISAGAYKDTPADQVVVAFEGISLLFDQPKKAPSELWDKAEKLNDQIKTDLLFTSRSAIVSEELDPEQAEIVLREAADQVIDQEQVAVACREIQFEGRPALIAAIGLKRGNGPRRG